eukprot:4639625-Amphidinium_carterae.2
MSAQMVPCPRRTVGMVSRTNSTHLWPSASSVAFHSIATQKTLTQVAKHCPHKFGTNGGQLMLCFSMEFCKGIARIRSFNHHTQLSQKKSDAKPTEHAKARD